MTEVAPATNPQYVTYGDGTVGFILPTYQSSQNTGCPPNLWEVSTVGTSVITPSNLLAPAVSGSNRLVKPTNNLLHFKYDFYIKVTALGNSAAFFA